jgi:hypothetical protein
MLESVGEAVNVAVQLLQERENVNMLIEAVASVSVVGFAFVLRKMSAACRSMLDLSDELNPARPPAVGSELKTPGVTNPSVPWEAAPVGDSLLRLSTAVSGVGRSYGGHADQELALSKCSRMDGDATAAVLTGAERGQSL